MHPTHAIPTTPQQRASHFLYLQGRYDEGLGVCTGTAIGPHAILTAAHCDKKNEVKSVLVDFSPEEHSVLGTVYDGRDHAIILVGGTPFTNIESVVIAEAKISEAVTIYGVGGSTYPPLAKFGSITDCQDPSDLDAAAGQFCASIHSIPGDSGSAIYNSDGYIVGIVTYLDQYVEPTGTVGYALNFTAKQLADAATFDGKATPKPAK